ncbi:MAG: hypothetical protein KKF56_05390 [Nanoarchaeota archaeon]|nr:hypothetical protein [Nanoarchaeota archaeon]
MAIKDWKIASSYVEGDGTIVFVWYKDKNAVMIESDRKYLKSHFVTIGELDTNALGDYKAWGKNKEFKTKSQALSYAKQYMRNN